MATIGIVGCGAIGTAIARSVADGTIPARLSAVCDIDVVKAQSLRGNLKKKPAVVSLKKLVSVSDIVVESAGVGSVKEIAEECIRRKKTLLVMSVGYFLLDRKLLERARKKRCRILFPSGALAGIDALRAARLGGIESVTLKTTKPPCGLKGAPYIDAHRIDLDRLDGPTVVFSGSPVEAMKGFPKNINVSALLSLNGIGPNRTRVTIVADPHAERNMHEVEITGASGRIVTRTENVPSPTNPKTSYLAVLSAISMLQEICNS